MGKTNQKTKKRVTVVWAAKGQWGCCDILRICHLQPAELLEPRARV